MRAPYLIVSLLLVAGCSDADSDGPETTIATPAASPELVSEADLTTQTDSAYGVDWGSDGQTLSVPAGVELVLLNGDLTEVAKLVPSSGALGAAASPDGLRYATVGGLRDSTITVWDWDPSTKKLTIAEEVDAGADQFAVSWSPDGQLLASLAGDRDSTLQVWDTTTWGLVDEYALPYANSRRALNWSADTELIYDAGEVDGEVGYFSIDARGGDVVELARLPLEQVVAFSMSPDGALAAVADAAGVVRVIEVSTNAVLAEFQAVADPVDLAWNSMDGTLAILSYSTALQVWANS